MKGWHLRLAYRRIGAQFTLTFPHWALGLHAEVVPDHSSFRVHGSVTALIELEVQAYWTRAYKAPAGVQDECPMCFSKKLLPQVVTDKGPLPIRVHICQACGEIAPTYEDIQANVAVGEHYRKQQAREKTWWYRAWRKVVG